MLEGWREQRLGEICELVNGRGFKPHEWKKHGLPIIRIQNLNGSDEFNYYSGEFDPKILVEPGQLLFAWSGSRGASFGPHIWNGPKGVLNYHTWKVHPVAETDRDYLFQLLMFETQKIEASSHGASALVHVQKGEMEQRKFALPPLPEQRRIAEILRTWDEAIEKLEVLRAAKERRFDALREKLIRRAMAYGSPTSFGSFLTESRVAGSDGATAKRSPSNFTGWARSPKKTSAAAAVRTRSITVVPPVNSFTANSIF